MFLFCPQLLRGGPLHNKARVRPPLHLHLLPAKCLFDLLDLDELLDAQDLAGRVLRRRMEDGLGAFAQAEREQDAAGLVREPDRGAQERDAEVGHLSVRFPVVEILLTVSFRVI
jgi:hypothetical protein